MADARDFGHMARALRLAAQGLYTTDPNPRVGCVVVQGDRVVGEGYHRRAGEPHAEVHARVGAAETCCAACAKAAASSSRTIPDVTGR